MCSHSDNLVTLYMHSCTHTTTCTHTTHMHTHTHAHTHTHTHMHTHARTRTHARMHTHTHTHTQTYPCTHTHTTHTHTHTHMHPHHRPRRMGMTDPYLVQKRQSQIPETLMNRHYRKGRHTLDFRWAATKEPRRVACLHMASRGRSTTADHNN